MKIFLKEVAFHVLPKLRLKNTQASILMYHSVGEQNGYFSTVSPADFARQLHYLASRRIPVITLRELSERVQHGHPLNGAVVLTFDDGYEDNYSVVFPLLQEYHFPVTIFLTTDQVGKKKARGMQYLSEAQIREMSNSGLVTFEPHTKTHPRLSTLSYEEARAELYESRSLTQTLTNKVCHAVAYPYGDFDEDTIRLVRELGFSAACSVREGLVSVESNCFTLPRNAIDRSTTFTQFSGKVSRVLDWYLLLKSALRP